jgi:cellulose synthase/poly-beta-1,6-N-acetylglucosamine synthase-like glycosyltransferase
MASLDLIEGFSVTACRSEQSLGRFIVTTFAVKSFRLDVAMVIWLVSLLLILSSPLLCILLLDSLLRAWLMLVRWLTTPAQEPAPTETAETLAVIIPAHDEASVIGATVARLRPQAHPGGLFVIADNCADDTAAVARQAGARVWERHDPREWSKGAAMRWFLNVAGRELEDYGAIAIFDADSVVDQDFMHHARLALSQGADIAQGFVQPLSSGSPAADLAAYSEILSQRIDDMARARLGWPVPLRGAGMVLRRQVLLALLPQLQTTTEDVEMSLLLAAQGKRVQFVPQAIVGDPKPTGTRAVATQRARWQQGQRKVLHRHARLVLRQLFSGRPSQVSLIFATLLKPKTLVFLLKGLWLFLAVLLPVTPAGLRWVMVALAGLAISADLVYYLLGLSLVETPGRYARALVQAPLYPVMWLWSLLLSLISSELWLSARRDH